MQPQYPYPNYPPAPPQRHTVLDITLTVILSALAGISALVAVCFSFFFIMATDACGPRQCDFDALGAAYLVTWGGIGLAIVVGVVGIIVAAIRKATMWIWPAVSLVAIAISTGIGLSLANSFMNRG